MSDETVRRLAEARAEEALRLKEADRLKAEYLERVAEKIPAAIEDYVKKLAFAQPEVTKQLGRDGVAAMRKQISETAAALSIEVTHASDAVEWPDFRLGYRTRQVDSALFDYLYGHRVNKFDSILRTFGYQISEHGGLHPHSLHQGVETDSLKEALIRLASATAAVESAIDADDHDAVESLWEDTE